MSTTAGRALARRGTVVLIVHQLRFEQLNFWRNRFAAVTTLGFSVIFLVLSAASSGHSAHSAALGGAEVLQYYVPGFAAYGVMAACYSTLGIQLVNRRETGLLKRLYLSPLPTPVLFGALFVNALVVSLIQVVVIVLVGRFAYGLLLPHEWLALACAVAVGVLCFTALGIAVSAAVPSQDSAGPLINLVFFALLFLSGLWFPLSNGSTLARLSDWFPIRHLILAFWRPFDPMPGVSPWSWHDLGVVALWGVAATIVALRRFSFEPRRG